MKEERKKILEMLAEGKIKVDEAEKLLKAVEEKDQKIEVNDKTEQKIPEYLFIKVEPKKEHGDRVNIKIPIKLIKAGMKLASFMPKGVQSKINDKLEANGLDINLSNINPDNLNEFLLTLKEFSIDVDEADEKVKIYCE